MWPKPLLQKNKSSSSGHGLSHDNSNPLAATMAHVMYSESIQLGRSHRQSSIEISSQKFAYTGKKGVSPETAADASGEIHKQNPKTKRKLGLHSTCSKCDPKCLFSGICISVALRIIHVLRIPTDGQMCGDSSGKLGKDQAKPCLPFIKKKASRLLFYEHGVYDTIPLSLLQTKIINVFYTKKCMLHIAPKPNRLPKHCMGQVDRPLRMDA